MSHTHRLLRGIPGSALLLPPAALAVHQARYWLAFGAGTGAALERTGHAYLHSLVPWSVAALALAAGLFLRSLGRAFAGRTTPGGYGLSFAALWLACWTALVGIFVCQELIEGWVLVGHPAGLAGVFGYGGWWALPAAAPIALVLAAWYHGARWLISEVARRYAGAHVPRRLLLARRLPHPRGTALRPPLPLVAGWSDRGPPPR